MQPSPMFTGRIRTLGVSASGHLGPRASSIQPWLLHGGTDLWRSGKQNGLGGAGFQCCVPRAGVSASLNLDISGMVTAHQADDD